MNLEVNNVPPEPFPDKGGVQLSVIVPVYNTEKYLARCIQSVLGQSYADIELIVIDDGSGSECKRIVEHFSSGDARVKYYRQPSNQGLLAARIKGIELSQGDYITHLDSDDWISEDVYSSALSISMDHDSTLTIFNLEVVDAAGEVLVAESNQQENFINNSGRYVLDKILRAGGADWSWHLSHNKIWKAAFLKKYLDTLPAGHLVMCEDLLLSLYYISLLADQPVCSCINTTKGLYYYKHAASSTVKKDDIRHIIKNIRDVLAVKRFILGLSNATYLTQNRALVIDTFRRIGKLNYPPLALFKYNPVQFIYAYYLQLRYIDFRGPFEKMLHKMRSGNQA